MSKVRRFDFILKAQVFIAGAAVLSLEILGSRLLAPNFGNSLFVWGSLIGVVLTALSIGYYLGGKISENNGSYHGFSLILFAAGAYTLLLTAGSSAVFEGVLALRLGERYGPLAATMILLGIPSILLGMISPYAVKLRTVSIEKAGTVAGNLYSLSTVGSIVGTFLTVFVLIPEFEVTRILYSISILLLGASILGLAVRWKPIAIVVLIGAAALAASASTNPPGVVFQKETLYHHLVVFDNTVTGVRTLLLDNNFHSAMDLRNPNRTVFLYTDYFHLGFIFTTDAKKALFIGGGGFSTPKKFLRDYSNITLDVVEIDGDVVDAANRFFLVPQDGRLSVHVQDGREYLKNVDQKYDIIILDAYARTYIPFHLMTREFFQLLNSHLTVNGVIATNIITSMEGETSAIFKAQYKTLKQVFPQAYVFPVSTTNPAIIQNVIVIATKSSEQLTKEEVVQRAESLDKVKIASFSDYAHHFWERNIDTEAAPVLRDDYAPVENMVNPLTGVPFAREVADVGTITVQGSDTPNTDNRSASLTLTSTVILASMLAAAILIVTFLGIYSRRRQLSKTL